MKGFKTYGGPHASTPKKPHAPKMEANKEHMKSVKVKTPHMPKVRNAFNKHEDYDF